MFYTLFYNIVYTHTKKITIDPNQDKNNFVKLLATSCNDYTQPRVHTANLRLACLRIYWASPIGFEVI